MNGETTVFIHEVDISEASYSMGIFSFQAETMGTAQYLNVQYLSKWHELNVAVLLSFSQIANLQWLKTWIFNSDIKRLSILQTCRLVYIVVYSMYSTSHRLGYSSSIYKECLFDNVLLPWHKTMKIVGHNAFYLFDTTMQGMHRWIL